MFLSKRLQTEKQSAEERKRFVKGAAFKKSANIDSYKKKLN